MFYLLIAVTALRGMVGDVMAVEMDTIQMAAQHQEYAVQQAATHAMPCHDAAGADDESLVSQCKTCQVCNLGVFVSCDSTSTATAAVSLKPALSELQFFSANIARLAKPPVL